MLQAMNARAARHFAGARVSIATTAIAWTCLAVAEAGDLFTGAEAGHLFLLKIAFLVAGFTAAVVALAALALERTALALGALLLALPACALAIWWIRSAAPSEF
jgi:hypothetical protein